MTNTALPVPAMPSGVAELSSVDTAAVKGLLVRSVPKNTARAYAAGLNHWMDFVSDRNINPWHPSPAQVAAFVASREADGASLSSIRTSLAALAWGCDKHDAPNPCMASIVKQAVKGVSRSVVPPKQATPVNEELLDRMIRKTMPRRPVFEPTLHRALMKCAFFSLMRDGLLRVSEAATVQWGDVEFNDDLSGTVKVVRHKTNTQTTAYFSRPTGAFLLELTPLFAKTEELLDKRVFPRSERVLRGWVTTAAEACGVKGVSSHSFRVGMAQDLTAAGESLPALMQAGGWTSPDMPALYASRQEAARGAVARYYANKSDVLPSLPPKDGSDASKNESAMRVVAALPKYKKMKRQERQDFVSKTIAQRRDFVLAALEDAAGTSEIDVPTEATLAHGLTSEGYGARFSEELDTPCLGAPWQCPVELRREALARVAAFNLFSTDNLLTTLCRYAYGDDDKVRALWKERLAWNEHTSHRGFTQQTTEWVFRSNFTFHTYKDRSHADIIEPTLHVTCSFKYRDDDNKLKDGEVDLGAADLAWLSMERAMDDPLEPVVRGWIEYQRQRQEQGLPLIRLDENYPPESLYTHEQKQRLPPRKKRLTTC